MALLLLAGCGSGRKSNTVTGIKQGYATDVGMINAKNIASVPFSISRMRMFYTEGSNTNRLTANMKYHPDRGYLISARSVAGIEIARILFSDDTLHILDRVNRVYYINTTKDIVKRFGIRPDKVPSLFGHIDIDEERYIINQECSDTLIFNNNGLSGSEEFKLDCGSMELVQYTYYDSGGKNDLELYYAGYKSIEKFTYPGEINLINRNRNISLRVIIDRIDLMEDYTVKFSINEAYERKKL
jgi:hypothetical protein